MLMAAKVEVGVEPEPDCKCALIIEALYLLHALLCSPSCNEVDVGVEP